MSTRLDPDRGSAKPPDVEVVEFPTSAVNWRRLFTLQTKDNYGKVNWVWLQRRFLLSLNPQYIVIICKSRYTTIPPANAVVKWFAEETN